jgi:hypothetical protein
MERRAAAPAQMARWLLNRPTTEGSDARQSPFVVASEWQWIGFALDSGLSCCRRNGAARFRRRVSRRHAPAPATFRSRLRRVSRSVPADVHGNPHSANFSTTAQTDLYTSLAWGCQRLADGPRSTRGRLRGYGRSAIESAFGPTLQAPERGGDATRVATVSTSVAIGFATCMSKPAASAASRSAGRLYAVSAMVCSRA